MAYTPPSGWIEALDAKNVEADPQLGIFHITDHCPRIKRPDLLRGSDRPYSSRPCAGCAKHLRS